MSNISIREKGKINEDLCQKYIEKLSYKVLRRNWCCNWGELDIIARDVDTLVFIEVKSVSNLEFCKPVELFGKKKRMHLLRTINYFLLKNKVKNWRLDLVCITNDQNRIWIEHYKNVLAF